MATWAEINDLIAKAGQNGQDIIRRSKLTELQTITGRPVIIYAVEMFNRRKIDAAGGEISIDLTDKEGFKEALKDIKGKKIDVILHSPGGSPEATETIVKLLRSRFNDIRFLIPNIAKSAATMLSMSGDEIILGDDAELGPTDPQMVIKGRLNPAHAIIKQFSNARDDLSKNSEFLTAWLPILEQYGPSLLVECDNAIKLTETLVKTWLTSYMFSGQKNAKRKAVLVSKFLANKKHLSHGRAINVEELQQKGVKVKRASDCKPSLSVILQDINLVVLQTFAITGAFKIFENSVGRGFYRVVQQQVVQLPMTPLQQVPTQSPTRNFKK